MSELEKMELARAGYEAWSRCLMLGSNVVPVEWGELEQVRREAFADFAEVVIEKGERV